MSETGTTIDGTVIPVNAQPFVAQLKLATFDDLIQRSTSIAQKVCPEFTDFSAGSPSLALMSCKAYADLWMQWLVYVVFLNSRFFTARGAGVDTWAADFGLGRHGATYSVGYVTMGRYSYATQASIPVGKVVQTEDQTQRFAVLADPENQYFDEISNSYIIPSGTAQIDVMIQAVTGGSAGNVKPNTINKFFQMIPGINFVSNAEELINGRDGESDESFKARFVPYINSRTGATADAIITAILSIDPTLTYQIVENGNGVWPFAVDDVNSGKVRAQFGFMTIYIDSGRETLTDANTVKQVSLAVNAVRPLSVDYWVTVPSIITVDIEYLLDYASGYNTSVVKQMVRDKVITYVNTLPVGGTLNYFRLATIIDETPGVKNIRFLVVAGQEGNIGCGPGSILKMGTLTYK